jgi:uncharacterized protein YjbI with pentapeptide repeats
MARTRRGTARPHPPDLAPTRDPAPARLASGDLWDGVEAGPDVEVPVHVDDVVLQESRWTGAHLAGRRFGGLRVRDVEFVRCDLSAAVLEDAVLDRVRFVGCRLTGVVLSGATLTDVQVTDSSADLAVLRMARASFLRVCDTSLRGADLFEATAADSALLRCDLTGTDLERAVLTGTDLHGSVLDDLRGALALRGCRIGADQLVPAGAAVLDALGIRITERE